MSLAECRSSYVLFRRLELQFLLVDDKSIALTEYIDNISLVVETCHLMDKTRNYINDDDNSLNSPT